MTPDKNKKVLVGLSGGVDSTAVALLLKKEGYEVTGLFFDVLADGKEAGDEVKRIASDIGVKLICMDISDVFREKVISYFCSEYAGGRTPNPCIFCNENIKFRVLLDTADEIGAFHVATGHYANVIKAEESFHYIRCGRNTKKDQSYMLYRLGQDVLGRLMLPLGRFESKDEVRDIVRGYDISNADRKDSQEICFIRDGDYVRFIENLGYDNPPGDFIDGDGNVIGRHKGILNYTLGQRKGLGITMGRPVFVSKIDNKNNTVTLSDEGALFTYEICSKDNVIGGYPLSGMSDDVSCGSRGSSSDDVSCGSRGSSSDDVSCGGYNGGSGGEYNGGSGGGAMEVLRHYEGRGIQAKIRYSARPASCTVSLEDGGRLRTVFSVPQRAATPGQSVVFYHGDIMIGGGIIT